MSYSSSLQSHYDITIRESTQVLVPNDFQCPISHVIENE